MIVRRIVLGVDFGDEESFGRTEGYRHVGSTARLVAAMPGTRGAHHAASS